MLLLVQLLSSCSGIEFMQPYNVSCDKVRGWVAGRAHDDHTCECDGSGACTLSVTLQFGHVVIPKERTGLKGELHLLWASTCRVPLAGRRGQRCACALEIR